MPLVSEVAEGVLEALEVNKDGSFGKILEDGELDEGCITRELWLVDMEGGTDGGPVSSSVVVKEADSRVQSEDRLMVSNIEGDKDELESPTPLRTITPKLVYNLPPDWLLKTVEEVQECVGISFAGYED